MELKNWHIPLNLDKDDYISHKNYKKVLKNAFLSPANLKSCFASF